MKTALFVIGSVFVLTGALFFGFSVSSPDQSAFVSQVRLAITAAVGGTLGSTSGTGVQMTPVSLYTPFFKNGPAPAAENAEYVALQNQIVHLGFFLRPSQASTVHFVVEITKTGTSNPVQIPIQVFTSEYVNVEGNTNNGSCTCPAGQLPSSTSGSVSCVPAAQAVDFATCPDTARRAVIAANLIHQAPFAVADALIPVPDAGLSLDKDNNRVVVVRFTTPAAMPGGVYSVRIRALSGSTAIGEASRSVRVHDVQMPAIPTLITSRWLAWWPRDLVARPAGVAITSEWGPSWWSDEHWGLLQVAWQLLRQAGSTGINIPLFVTDPFEPHAKPLIPLKCITGTTQVPADFKDKTDSQFRSAFNDAIQSWTYQFDFTNFRRAIGGLKGLGFTSFEGDPVTAQTDLPNYVYCDLYETAQSPAPYKTNFLLFPRQKSTETAWAYSARKGTVYQKFLSEFFGQLKPELVSLGIQDSYNQHISDENKAGADAAYRALVSTVRAKVPNIKIMDTIVNVSSAPDLTYAGYDDYPILNIQSHFQASYSTEIANLRTSASGKLFFYNTGNPTPGVGPNVGLDEPMLNQRTYPWFAIEKNLTGYLYWASNQYRYPTQTGSGRTDDWTPFTSSIGPLPSGRVAPGHPPGTNWFLYPTQNGLVSSLRLVAYYEGVVDNAVYGIAKARCGASCPQLDTIVDGIVHNRSVLKDYDKKPADFDSARTQMLKIAGSTQLPQPTVTKVAVGGTPARTTVSWTGQNDPAFKTIKKGTLVSIHDVIYATVADTGVGVIYLPATTTVAVGDVVTFPPAPALSEADGYVTSVDTTKYTDRIVLSWSRQNDTAFKTIAKGTPVKINGTVYLTFTGTGVGLIYLPKNAAVSVGNSVKFVSPPPLNGADGYVTGVIASSSPARLIVSWSGENNAAFKTIPKGTRVTIAGTTYSTVTGTGVGKLYLPSTAKASFGDLVKILLAGAGSGTSSGLNGGTNPSVTDPNFDNGSVPNKSN